MGAGPGAQFRRGAHMGQHEAQQRGNARVQDGGALLVAPFGPQKRHFRAVARQMHPGGVGHGPGFVRGVLTAIDIEITGQLDAGQGIGQLGQRVRGAGRPGVQAFP